MIYTIHSETPAKKNSRITLRNGKTIPSAKYRQWHSFAMSELLLQKDRFAKPIDCPVKIKVHFVHGDLRRRDSDNGLSSILDLLQDCSILLDDRWEIVQEVEIKNSYSKNNPVAEIEILTL